VEERLLSHGAFSSSQVERAHASAGRGPSLHVLGPDLVSLPKSLPSMELGALWKGHASAVLWPSRAKAASGCSARCSPQQ
jgi:hypothetical protein